MSHEARSRAEIAGSFLVGLIGTASGAVAHPGPARARGRRARACATCTGASTSTCSASRPRRWASWCRAAQRARLRRAEHHPPVQAAGHRHLDELSRRPRRWARSTRWRSRTAARSATTRTGRASRGLRAGAPRRPLDRVVQLGAGGAGRPWPTRCSPWVATRRPSWTSTARAAEPWPASSRPLRGDRVDGGASTSWSRRGAADGLVHATPTGMAAHPGSRCRRSCCARTSGSPTSSTARWRPSCRTARPPGCGVLDGGGMAVFQAADAFRLFTGSSPTPTGCSGTSRRWSPRPGGRPWSLTGHARIARSPPSACPARWRTSCRGGRRGLRRHRDLRARPDRLPLGPGRVRQRPCADLGLRSTSTSRSATSRRARARPFARNLRRAERKFDVMQELGADTILVCSNVSPAAVETTPAAEQLRRAGRARPPRAASGSPTRRWPGAARQRLPPRLVDRRAATIPPRTLPGQLPHPFPRRGPAGIRDIPGEKIFFLQLADAPHLDMDVLQWSRHYRLFPGQGGFDLAGFLGHVLRAGYDGPLSLEVFNDVFRRPTRHGAAVDALRSLLGWRRRSRCAVPTSAWPRRHRRPRCSATRSPNSPSTGVSKPELALALTALGFHPHRPAPVEARPAEGAGWGPGAAQRAVVRRG